MKTNYQIALTVKEMMANIPLEEISVTAITKKCNINRQTFYYHYHDVYDVLTVLFLNEKIDKIDEAKSTVELIKAIYSYYEKNAKFIDATLNSASKDLVKEFIYNACYQTILRMVLKSIGAGILSFENRKAIARFYASAYSNSIVYYLINYQNKTLNNLLQQFAFTGDADIIKAVSYLSKGKSNS